MKNEEITEGNKLIAETKVKVAEQDKLQQKIAYEGAIFEGKKIKELADAKAYEKEKVMHADGALDKKLEAYVAVQTVWAEAFSKHEGPVTPTYMFGGLGGAGNYNAVSTFMELQNAKAMHDLNLNMQNK